MNERDNKKEELGKYENLQNEYKRLLEKYEQIKKDDPQSTVLEKTVKELDAKQKELQVILSKLS